MKKIRFTIGDSDVWHQIEADFDVYNEVQTGQVVASIIAEEMKRIRNTDLKPKKVEILNEKDALIASSTDICIIEELKFEC